MTQLNKKERKKERGKSGKITNQTPDLFQHAATTSGAILETIAQWQQPQKKEH